jgi:hypothetical protein
VSRKLTILNLLPQPGTKRYNVRVQRQQKRLNSAPATLNCPLHCNLWGDDWKRGDDHALGDSQMSTNISHRSFLQEF